MTEPHDHFFGLEEDPATSGSPVGTLEPPTSQYSPPANPFGAGPSDIPPPPQPSAGGGGGTGSFWPHNPYAYPPPAPPTRSRGIAALVAAALAAVAIFAGAGIGHLLWTSPAGNSPAASQSPNTNNPFNNPDYPFGNGGSNSTGNATTPGQGSPSNVAAIASKVQGALVDINTNIDFGSGAAAGTGMVLTSDGEVLTNNHVIGGATSITATDVGNGKTYQASVVGYDASHDVAVIQLHNASGLQTISISNSSNVATGTGVVAIGNAGGTGGTPSAAGGSITATNQPITATDEADGASEQLTGLFETNAALQPGDSGGPLVNASGQVIGMDTAASAGFSFSASGQGYAIPISNALSVAHEITGGHGSTAVHIGDTGFLGIQVSTQQSNGNIFGGNNNNVNGAYVQGVSPGGPAAKAGLVAGDTITSFGGQNVDSPTALSTAKVKYHPGDQVQVGWVDQSGTSHSATVTLANGPAD